MENEHNEEIKTKFNVILQTMIRDHVKRLEKIIHDPYILKFELAARNQNSAYFEKCEQLYENTKKFSKEIDKEKTLSNYVKVNAKPNPKKEREFKTNLEQYKNCADKFAELNNKFTLKKNHLNLFTMSAAKKCAEDNCAKLVDISDTKTKQCINDCFTYDRINRMVMVGMNFDENLKLIYEVNKLLI
jgi:hypothetical protein